jgi:hypothetical protein
MLAVVIPIQESTKLGPAVAAVFPGIPPDTKWRSEKWVLAELVDTDFGQDHRKSRPISQANGEGAVDQVNEKAIHRPEGSVNKKLRTFCQPAEPC